eukprot:Selendium_serpulae@DN5062_c0_g1_i3.p1
MLMGGTATLFYGCYLAMLAVMLVCAVYPLPSIVQMMVYTFSMIFIGSHRSLMQKEVDPDSGERVSQHETLTQRDAMLFPIIASASLLGLYLAYKFLPPFWVNVLLASYVSVVGIVTLSQSIASMLDNLNPGTSAKIATVSLDPFHWFSQGSEWDLDLTVNYCGALVVATCLSVGWLVTKNWILHNVLAIAFSIEGIAFISVGSFRIATILLCLLFFYDVFWVFGTDVMVTVAKSFEGPIKIIMPRSIDPFAFSILGLGDIVIPGVLIAMTLRFDSHLHQMEQRWRLSAPRIWQSSRESDTLDASSTLPLINATLENDSLMGLNSEGLDAQGPGIDSEGPALMGLDSECAGMPTGMPDERRRVDEDGGAQSITHKKTPDAKSGNDVSSAIASGTQKNETAATTQKRTSQSTTPEEGSAGADTGNDAAAATGPIDIHKKFHKFFFWSCMVGYQIGLGITTAVMLMFNAPQPALLYLVPTCLAAVYLPASLTGRMSQILSYSESTEEDPEEEARETTTSPAKEKAKDEGNIEMKETLLSAS